MLNREIFLYTILWISSFSLSSFRYFSLWYSPPVFFCKINQMCVYNTFCCYCFNGVVTKTTGKYISIFYFYKIGIYFRVASSAQHQQRGQAVPQESAKEIQPCRSDPSVVQWKREKERNAVKYISIQSPLLTAAVAAPLV